MITDFVAAWIHFRIRLAWTLREPRSALVLLVFSLLALLHTADPGALVQDLEPELRWVATMVWVMWLYLWPALPAMAASGRTTGGQGTAMRLRAFPTLPVGPRARAAAETCVVLAYVVLVRVIARWAFPAADVTGTGTATNLDLLVMVPTIVAWAAPAPSINFFLLRPLALATLLAIAVRLGMTSTVVGLVSTTLAVTGLCLATVGHEWRSPRIRRRVPRAVERVRPGIDPARRLTRDAWRLPMATWGPVVLSLVLLVVVLLALDLYRSLPVYALPLLGGLLVSAGIVLSLRPFDSNLIGMGLSGKQGARIGDFMRAWSVLPVRPGSVLRLVWLHGLAVMGGLWLGFIIALMVRSWVRFGRPGLLTADGGNLAVIVIPLAATAPCLAGLLVAAAVGDRTRSIISGVCFLLVFYGHLSLLGVLASVFGRESNLPVLIDGAFLAGLALLGGMLPLVHLRRGRPGWTGT
jgi:hypothetical protein